MQTGKAKDATDKKPVPARGANEVEERQEREGPDRERAAHPVRITQEQAQQWPPARDPDEPLAP